MDWKVIGASLSEPHTSVVYGTTCIDRPTNRPCPSHSRDTDTLHMPTLPSRHATLMSDMWTVQCVVEIATRLRTPTMGKRKAETPAQRTARLEWERLANLFILALPCRCRHASLGFTYVSFSHRSLHTSLFHTFLHNHNMCTLHSGQDLHTRNAYGRP